MLELKKYGQSIEKPRFMDGVENLSLNTVFICWQAEMLSAKSASLKGRWTYCIVKRPQYGPWIMLPKTPSPASLCQEAGLAGFSLAGGQCMPAKDTSVATSAPNKRALEVRCDTGRRRTGSLPLLDRFSLRIGLLFRGALVLLPRPIIGLELFTIAVDTLTSAIVIPRTPEITLIAHLKGIDQKNRVSKNGSKSLEVAVIF